MFVPRMIGDRQRDDSRDNARVLHVMCHPRRAQHALRCAARYAGGGAA
jgi:hypothetical protein